MSADENVNHPQHYTAHPSGVECVDIAEHLSFNLGNALKYVWRAGKKHPEKTREDIAKALWYVRRESRLLDFNPQHPMGLDGPTVRILIGKTLAATSGQPVDVLSEFLNALIAPTKHIFNELAGILDRAADREAREVEGTHTP
jgi:hypothetical protein